MNPIKLWVEATIFGGFDWVTDNFLAGTLTGRSLPDGQTNGIHFLFFHIRLSVLSSRAKPVSGELGAT